MGKRKEQALYGEERGKEEVVFIDTRGKLTQLSRHLMRAPVAVPQI